VLEFVNEDETAYALVNILLIMCSVLEKQKDKENIVLKDIVAREDRFRDLVLKVLNRAGQFNYVKCLEAISLIIKTTSAKEFPFFGYNDIDFIIGCCLKNLEKTNDSAVRAETLKVIFDCVKTPTFKQYPDRLKELDDSVTQWVLSEESEDMSYSLKEREYIARINLEVQSLS